MICEFDDIRPYHDSEINGAMLRIVENPVFDKIAGFLYPGVPLEDIKNKFRAFDSIESFQGNVMNTAIQLIMKESSTEFLYSGLDQLPDDKSYLFISNHRDVLLDAAILQVLLKAHNHDTTEITFGDNLMSSDFIVDIGKSNKMFRLIRGGSPKMIFVNSMHTSKYIRYCINTKKESIWIAQRNGRTKGGNDKTQLSVLKMFALSGSNDFAENFAELNLVPVIISFEYDPCDFLKTRELYISRRQTYVKSTGEDINSMITGIQQNKGKVQLVVTDPLSFDELNEMSGKTRNEKIESLAELIDKRIYENYRLSNTNYIAYDILCSSRFNDIYSSSEKEAFIDYMHQGLSKIDGDRKELESIFLAIYANPVINYLKINSSGRQTIPDSIRPFIYTV